MTLYLYHYCYSVLLHGEQIDHVWGCIEQNYPFSKTEQIEELVEKFRLHRISESDLPTECVIVLTSLSKIS